MAKYYVKSGSLRLVVQADNSQGAALWAVHRCMSRMLPFLEGDEVTDLSPVSCYQLEDRIYVCEQGFEEDHDWQSFATLDAISQWNQLLVALDRLGDQILSDDTDDGGTLAAEDNQLVIGEAV